eukprot:CAMPEP_0204025160 /NCGR_PEP_ID=MMETSP0360-20130528/41598_1 /ASSEMBLY_ACC=CAM_ASM_000342 /TAXON_ID=268821 /ORGANISM="Scrippsiella Hangoei, Strain SHTV-5" /LENGTH=39 /DNA_ID= /DNA_START= /DNA_END= /DNA_ORIENTATION=
MALQDLLPFLASREYFTIAASGAGVTDGGGQGRATVANT